MESVSLRGAARALAKPHGGTINGLVNPVGLSSDLLRFVWRWPVDFEKQEEFEISIRWLAVASGDSLFVQRTVSDRPAAEWMPPANWENGWLAWQVRCRDTAGQQTGWSDPAYAFLRPASLAPACWLGGAGYHFIRRVIDVPDIPLARAALLIVADAHSYVREHWDSMEEPGKVADNWMFGGSHIKYRAYVNGELIALGPPRSIAGNPTVQGFEITENLVPGRNVLAFIVLGEAKGLAATMHLEDVEGNRAVVATDSSWRMRAAGDVFRPVCWDHPGMDYYFKGFAGPGVLPEHLDGTHWPGGWLDADFDDSAWFPAEEQGLAAGPFEDAALPPYVFREVAFLKVCRLEAGRFCFDVGQQVFGSVRIRFSGREIGDIEVRLGEELREDGSVRYRLRTENCYQERWKAPGEATALEHLGCRAFRYVELIGLPDDFPLEMVSVRIPEYPWDPDASQFSCSDARLERVWELCRYSIRATNFDIYTDCLSRERQPYEGDAYITALSHYATQDDSRLARRTFDYLIHHPTWPQEWVLMAPMLLWMDYWQTGEAHFALSHVERIWAYFGPWLSETGLVEKFPNALLVDWPPATRDDYEFGPAAAVPNAYLHEALRCLERLLSLAGREPDAIRVRTRAVSLRQAFHERLFASSENLYVDHAGSTHASFHANLYALRFGLVPGEQRARIVHYLVERGLVGSVFTSQFFLETLFAFGEAETAVHWMTQDGVPGWLAMMDRFGATATMEAWSPEEKKNVSFGHPWASAPVNVVASGLFGLRAASPGWETFVFQPQPGGISSAKLRLPTPRGVIEASWRVVADGTVISSVSAPASCRRILTEDLSSHPSPGWLGCSLV